MIHRQTLLNAAIAAGVIALASGCANLSGGSSAGSGTPPTSSAPAAAPAAAAPAVYAATLSPAEEVPPAANSKGQGAAEVSFDQKTMELTWKVAYTGLTGPATMAHIHGPASPGSNAGVVVPFPGVAGAQGAQGKQTLTQAQYGDLAAGLYYVNVHTAQYPGGEIRGQLRKK